MPIVDKIDNDILKAEADLHDPDFLAQLGSSGAYRSVDDATAMLDARLKKISEHFVIDDVKITPNATLIVRWHHGSSGREERTSTLLVPSWS